MFTVYALLSLSKKPNFFVFYFVISKIQIGVMKMKWWLKDFDELYSWEIFCTMQEMCNNEQFVIWSKLEMFMFSFHYNKQILTGVHLTYFVCIGSNPHGNACDNIILPPLNISCIAACQAPWTAVLKKKKTWVPSHFLFSLLPFSISFFSAFSLSTMLSTMLSSSLLGLSRLSVSELSLLVHKNIILQKKKKKKKPSHS